jgi:endonuclease G, mitochondrial
VQKLVALSIGLLFAVTVLAQDSYLELRANANAYRDPDRESALVAKLKVGTGGKLVLLKLVSSERQNGYYSIEIPDSGGTSGWVYKSFVRGYSASGTSGSSPGGSGSGTGTASYGDCSVLFAEGKVPRAPDQVTPLCEEDGGVVFFATGYSKRDNHGYWSAYSLSEDQIQEMENDPLPRPKVSFRQNPKLAGGGYVQPSHGSYTGTDWDRGHLAPNGAMAWDEDAQKRSFTISNIAPQKPAMNRNIWRCFEVSIREWAATSGNTYVVVGTTRGAETISGSKDPKHVKINVPTHYIAMVYREKPKPMALGVMVPNTEGNLDIRKYVMSVNDLEKKSGFDFGIAQPIASKHPDMKQWPTRLVRRELLGKLPSIDTQCPKVPGAV